MRRVGGIARARQHLSKPLGQIDVVVDDEDCGGLRHPGHDGEPAVATSSKPQEPALKKCSTRRHPEVQPTCLTPEDVNAQIGASRCIDPSSRTPNFGEVLPNVCLSHNGTSWI